MNTTVNNTAGLISVPKGPITVDEIKDSLKKGLREAQIRQVFVKSYPSAKTSNEFKDSLFDNDELGLTTTDHEETRVTWIPVHIKHKTKDVEKALESLPDACIYKVLSHNPIITSDQRRVLENGLSGDAFEDFAETNNLKKTEWDEECSAILLEKISASQLVVYGEDNDQEKDADEAVLFNGRKQFRQTFFSKTARPDMDLRGIQDKQEIPELLLATEEVEETVKA